MLILLHYLLAGGKKILTTAGPASAHKFGELSMNPSNYVRSPAQTRQYIPLALGTQCQARPELSSLALRPAKALPGPILGPAPGHRTQFDITIIDPANICFYLPILTHTAFVD